MTRVSVDLPPVSVIIAAYNEQAFIETTVTSILDSGFPSQVIVVDDGSTDRTPEMLERLGGRAEVITHPTNRGKGAALASGLSQATGEIVIFCDAHLLGLRQQHLLSLALPLAYGSAKAVLGVSVPEGISASMVRAVPSLILTGQRAYHRADLLPLANEMEHLGYGVETFLFTRFPRDRTAVVLLPGLVHLTKGSTSTFTAATLGYLRESLEVLETFARIKGLVPKEVTALRQRVSVLLARYAGTRESTDNLSSARLALLVDGQEASLTLDTRDDGVPSVALTTEAT
jgi:hypothetical protein